MVYDPRKTIKKEESKQICDHVGCSEPGEHRAPRSRDNLREYYWFCLKHVKEYNLSWNYFEDMSEDQISTYRHNTATWHRPTWDRTSKNKKGKVTGHDFKIEEPFGFFSDSDDSKNKNRTTTAPVAKALNIMNLNSSSSPDEIKTKYKELAKRYHPDLNGGSKEAEERLKRINEAYSVLLASGYT